MSRKSTDFPKDVLIAARNNTIIYHCVHLYLAGTLTEYEALTKMVVLLAEENKQLQQQLTDEIHGRTAQVRG